MGRRTTGYLYQRGNNWALKWQYQGKTFCRSLGTSDRTEAERLAQKVINPFNLSQQADVEQALVDRLTGQRIEAEAAAKDVAGSIPLAKSWSVFLTDPSRPQCGTGSLEDYRCLWDRFIGWMAKEHPSITMLNAVTFDHVTGFSATLSNLSPNRYNKAIRCCRLVYSVVVPDVPCPFKRVKTRRAIPHGHRELSEAELRSVCQAATGEYRTLLAVGLYTALRLKDASLLSWQDVKLDQNMIVVTPAKTARTGKIVKIPLHPVLRSILEETPEPARRGHVMPGLAKAYNRDSASYSRSVSKLFQDQGIVTSEKHDGQRNSTCVVGFHSLRHSFVTICAKAGVPLAIVQELCGHGSPAIQRAYIHMGAESTAKAIAALPAAFSIAPQLPNDGAENQEQDPENTTTRNQVVPFPILIQAMDDAEDQTWRGAWRSLREALREALAGRRSLR